MNVRQGELDQIHQGINVTPFETADEFILGIQNQYGTLLASYDTLANYKDELADVEKEALPLKERWMRHIRGIKMLNRICNC